MALRQVASPVIPGATRLNPIAENSGSNNNTATSLSSGNIENSIIRKLGKTNFSQVNVSQARIDSRINSSEKIYLDRIWAQKKFNDEYDYLLKIKGYAGTNLMQTALTRMQGYIRLMGPDVNRQAKMDSVKNILKYTILMGKAKKAQNPNVKRAFEIANKGWQNKTSHTKNHVKIMNNLQTVYNKYYNANGKPRGSEMNIKRKNRVLKRKASRVPYRTTNNAAKNFSKRGNWYANSKGNYITPNKGLTFYKIVGSQAGRYTVNTKQKLGENII
jgi:hypothetical protein